MSKLLLIDDDSLLVRMYQKKFELDGYEVVTALDGEEGLGKAQEVKPDFILLDIMMPKMDGIDVLKALKSDDATKDIPVILLTNVSSSEHTAEEGLELGALDYLVKANLEPAEVVKKVKEKLGQ